MANPNEKKLEKGTESHPARKSDGNPCAEPISNDFTKLVEECKKDLKPTIIHNASIRHARVLFEGLLEVAKEKKESVKIVSGTLSNHFYSCLINHIQQVLDAELDVEVLILNPSDDTSQDFVKMVNDYSNGEVRQAVKRQKGISGPHFIIVGDRRYRLETDQERKVAVASFDDSQTGTVLAELFQDMWTCFAPTTAQTA